MFEIYEHNKSDCIRLLNMIICEIPFIKSFSDDSLLERLLNLISIITNAFDNPNHQSLDSYVFDCEEDREVAIREWLIRHYNAKSHIDELNFNDLEDRTRVSILIINIVFKLRHSLKDIEQYLKDCQSFVHLDRQLNHMTRFDKLLEMVSNDSNRWKSEANYYKLKYEETDKLIERYQQNEIFNYNVSPRNQNLYKSRISRNKSSQGIQNPDKTNNQLINGLIDCQQICRSFLSRNSTNQSKESNINVFYVCVECDKRYSTKFDYNLHVLQDHKHFDVSQIICNFDKNLENQEIRKNDEMPETFLKEKKRTFKCIYYKCGKAFHHSNQLRDHFSGHQTEIDKYLSVYSDHTNAVLNRLRFTKSKARRLSPNDISNHTIINESEKLNEKSLSTQMSHSNNLCTVPLCQKSAQIDYFSIDKDIPSNEPLFNYYCKSDLKPNLITYSPTNDSTLGFKENQR